MKYSRIEHIAAGRFKAGKARNEIYQAYLGTCVGLALYDRKAKVGGMIHLLLPDPPSFAGSPFPEKYAATGVPMLIKAILDLGASPENLVASIAGGALMGPVSQMDINLDIGGRTTEITVSILEAAGIKTIKSETGGFFTCTLELDMATGQTVIQPAWESNSQAVQDFASPSLDDILNTVEQLKPIPQTALKILRMFQSGMGNIADIAQELGKDQVLSGQTLKICNSALFSGTKKIDSLKDAVLILGEDMLIKSVITAAVNTYYNQTGTSGYSLCKGGLFFHAVGVASLAEKIAEKTGKSSPHLAYTAGLLHDIGKVILDQFVADSAPLFFRNICLEDQSFIDSEKKLIGITHSEAGALLAKRWKFPANLSEVIRNHHTPEPDNSNQDLVYIIYLSDLLIEKFSVGFDIEKMQTKSFAKAIEHLGLTMKDFPKLVDTIPISLFNGDEPFDVHG